MKVIKKSNFAGLIQYMTNEQGKQERVGDIRITHCQSEDVTWATHEIEATQHQNQRAKGDKTYHLLISFPAGETPSPEALKDIEDKICASIGYGDHQRISVIHYDTDNFHIHVGINKIHPIRYTLHEPYLAYKKLGEVAANLEIEHGLQLTNHIPHKVGSENRADDMEHHAGVESLLGWIKRECLVQIHGAQSWSEIHQVMHKHGLEMHERGSGLIITNGSGIAVKASSVSRDCSKSKLEKRYGIYEGSIHGQLGSMNIDSGNHYSQQPIHMKSNPDELYARYKIEQSNVQFYRAADVSRARVRKDLLIERAKRMGRLKRAAIKLLKGAGINKRVLYTLVSKTLKADVEAVNKQYIKEREAIHTKYSQYQRCAWADWLKLKANEGDKDALTALRSRAARQSLQGNTITGSSKTNTVPDISPDNITKTGTIIYRVGACAIRDDGDSFKVSRGSSQQGLEAALRMAIDRYGDCITVNGSDKFKHQIVAIATSLKLNITFDDAILEQRRQDLIQIPKTEKNHEPTRQEDFERRRTNRGGNEDSGAVRTVGGARSNKPNIGRIGHQPPPESKNRLRNLPQLNVVQLISRGEVLLPGNVSGHVEHQRTQSNNQLRRDVSGTGAIRRVSAAADKYISERELTRQKIPDIPKHRRYDPTDEGSAQFAGIRQVDGEILVLLKRDEQIIVLPIDASTLHRVKRLSIGDIVALSSRSIILSKGRSR